jgi:sugar phosphate isomerase/epimerase
MTAKIGHSSPSFCHDDPVTTLAACADAGFDIWEIVGDGAHFLPEAGPRIAEAAASYDMGLQLHAPIGDVNLGSLNPRMWDLSLRTQEETLHAAAEAGITRVTVHPGNHSPLSRGHYDKVHEATRRALGRLDRLGQELGLELNLENMPTGWAFETVSAELLADLTDPIDMGWTLDLGHAHVAGRWDEFFAQAARIRNVHVHDNQGVTDDHLTLDEGGVPWRDALDRLVAAGYKGAYIVESRSHASGAASLALVRDHLSGSR